MEVRYTVVHRTAGPLATFGTAYEAGCELARIATDEPESLDDLWLERVEGGVAVEPRARVF